MREFPSAAIVSNRCWSVMINKMSGRLIFHSERGRRISDYFKNRSRVIKPEMFRSAQRDRIIDEAITYTSTNSLPVSRRNASTYLAELFSITSFGKGGAGGVLSQSSVSR